MIFALLLTLPPYIVLTHLCSHCYVRTPLRFFLDGACVFMILCDTGVRQSNLAAGDLKEALEKAKKAMKDTPTPEQAVKQLLADQKDQ